MAPLRYLLVLPVVCVSPLASEQFRLSNLGIGPVVIDTHVEIRQIRRSRAELTASARNESGVPIREAELCVRAAKQKKGCAFTLWITDIWRPGEKIEWTISGRAGQGFPAHDVLLIRLVREPENKLRSVRKVYVEQIEGNNGGMAREQLMAPCQTPGDSTSWKTAPSPTLSSKAVPTQITPERPLCPQAEPLDLEPQPEPLPHRGVRGSPRLL